MEDPIEELHRIRREYAASLGNDLDAIVADIRKREEEAKKKGVKFVSFAPKPVRTKSTRPPGDSTPKRV